MSYNEITKHSFVLFGLLCKNIAITQNYFQLQKITQKLL